MWRGRHRTPSLAPWAALLTGLVVTFPAGIPGAADGTGPRTPQARASMQANPGQGLAVKPTTRT